MAWKTSLTGTPSVRAFSRSSSTFTWGYVGSNAVKSEANSGRWRAAARNARVWAPSWSTVSEPLRSWSRKLKPAAAPKPLMVGMLNGKATASGIWTSSRFTRAMMPFTCSASSWRSSHGLRRTKMLPKFGW